MFNSSSMSAKSETGSPEPTSAIRPLESTPPDASTTCNRASDCDAIERNWLPKPFPFHASLIVPVSQLIQSEYTSIHLCI